MIYRTCEVKTIFVMLLYVAYMLVCRLFLVVFVFSKSCLFQKKFPHRPMCGYIFVEYVHIDTHHFYSHSITYNFLCTIMNSIIIENLIIKVNRAQLYLCASKLIASDSIARLDAKSNGNLFCICLWDISMMDKSCTLHSCNL